MARGRGELTPDEIRIRKDISDKLNSLLLLNNKKQIDIHNFTGIPKSTLTGYFKGTSIPNGGNVQKLADFFNVKKSDIDPRYSSEIGTSVRNKVSSIETIYNKLDTDRKQKVYSFAEAQLKQQNKKVVPLYGATAANPTELAYGDIDLDTTVETSVPDKADCALVVKGNSMEPEYQDGDIVFYKAQPTVENGEMAIVEIEGTGVTLKKVYMNYDDNMVILRSLNGDYDDRELEPEKVRILGKVVK